MLVGSGKLTREFITRARKRLFAWGWDAGVGSVLTSPQGIGAESSQGLEIPCEGRLARTM